ncbi:hypothetical protein [Vibrio taketomensis]|uniref:hypothetical protein n=1 Tax=Vibrio taketomensis TaxID=2572923 RepID=UPI002F968C01
MATGTGIAPIKAIVEELIAKEDKRKVYIYWGMRYKKNYIVMSYFLCLRKIKH